MEEGRLIFPLVASVEGEISLLETSVFLPAGTSRSPLSRESNSLQLPPFKPVEEAVMLGVSNKFPFSLPSL